MNRARRQPAGPPRLAGLAGPEGPGQLARGDVAPWCWWPMDSSMARQAFSQRVSDLVASFISGESKAETTAMVALQASAHASHEYAIKGLCFATLPAESAQKP